MPVPTQFVIARHAGVSRSTVAAILSQNCRTQLREETRRRVVSVAARLGYRPHRHAQVMRNGRSRMIGLIQFGGFLHVAIQRALHAAKAVHQQGYHLLATDTLWHPDGVTDAFNSMLDERVEGLLLVGPTAWFPQPALRQILASGIPVVSLSGVRFPGVPQVRSDVRQGMSLLTQHLLGLGYRRLALLTSWAGQPHDERRTWTTVERVAGFQQAVKTAGGRLVDIPPHGVAHSTPRNGFPFGSDHSASTGAVFYEETSADWNDPCQIGKTAMLNFLRRLPGNGQTGGNRPQAVLCSNDDWAVGALSACHAVGIRVPDDMGLTGFDNDVFGRHTIPALTTIEQPTQEIAQKAVELLLRIMKGQKLSAKEQLLTLPCKLVVRQSCGTNQSSVISAQ
ncbi:MAG: LacI family DNA-binding transcriptional regulator [Verrucomicrobia bacterium]|nr:LacI family DNA-binding transcriptional regulator [Verrucomicrobiota bacterium]